MKHFLLMCLFLSVVSVVYGQEAETPPLPGASSTLGATNSPYHHQGLYLELGGGKNAEAEPGFNPTPAGSFIALGYAFDPHWSAQIQWLEFISESKYTTPTEDRFVPEIKWTPFLSAVQPFLLAGVGLEVQSVSPGAWNAGAFPQQIYSYLDGLVGGGVQTNFRSVVNLFVEVHCNLVFVTSSTTGTTAPVVGGLQLDF